MCHVYGQPRRAVASCNIKNDTTKLTPSCGRYLVKRMIYNLEMQAARGAQQPGLYHLKQSNPANIKQFCITISKCSPQ